MICLIRQKTGFQTRLVYTPNKASLRYKQGLFAHKTRLLFLVVIMVLIFNVLRSRFSGSRQSVAGGCGLVWFWIPQNMGYASG